MAYVRAVIYRAGFNLQRLERDDHGIDGTIKSYATGMNRVDFQLKASYDYTATDDHIVYKLDVGNYNVLVDAEGVPAVLVLFAMPRDNQLWLEQDEQELRLRHCSYWMDFEGLERSANARSRTVYVPRANVFDVDAVSAMFSSADPGLAGALDEVQSW